MKRLIAAIALVLVVAGCGSDIDTGYVTKKVYHEAYWLTTYHCTLTDPKTGVCTLNMPITTLQPEEFEFRLKEGDKKGYVFVDSTTYHKYDVGMHFPDPR